MAASLSHGGKPSLPSSPGPQTNRRLRLQSLSEEGYESVEKGKRRGRACPGAVCHHHPMKNCCNALLPPPHSPSWAFCLPACSVLFFCLTVHQPVPPLPRTTPQARFLHRLIKFPSSPSLLSLLFRSPYFQSRWRKKDEWYRCLLLRSTLQLFPRSPNPPLTFKLAYIVPCLKHNSCKLESCRYCCTGRCSF